MNVAINDDIAEITGVLTRNGYEPHPEIRTENETTGIDNHLRYSLKPVGMTVSQESGNGFRGVYNYELELTYWNETTEDRNKNFILFDYLSSELSIQPKFKGFNGDLTFTDTDLDTTIGMITFSYGTRYC